ncbi:hypothetical protein D3C80_1374150 [compost metagenome]
MKAIAIIFCSMLAVLSVNAQTSNTDKPEIPVLQSKGYYSIGDNYKKLTNIHVKTFETESQVISKGYYSGEMPVSKIEINKNVVRKSEVKKGYYAIGNNIDKLQ